MTIAVSHIVDALSYLGGEAHIDKIVQRVIEIAPSPHPIDPAASIRARLQERCSTSSVYKGKDDLFYSVYGLDARKGYWGLKQDTLSPSNPDGFQDGADVFFEDSEGKATLRIHLRRERSTKLVRAFKAALLNLKCRVCDFDFQKFYGELGQDYIEAHHVIPVASLKDDSTTKLSDLVEVCANCHRMLHRKQSISWAELKKIFRNNHTK